MKMNQSGMGAAAVILVIGVLAAVGFAGWTVFTNNTNKAAYEPAIQSQKTNTESTEVSLANDIASVQIPKDWKTSGKEEPCKLSNDAVDTTISFPECLSKVNFKPTEASNLELGSVYLLKTAEPTLQKVIDGMAGACEGPFATIRDKGNFSTNGNYEGYFQTCKSGEGDDSDITRHYAIRKGQHVMEFTYREQVPSSLNADGSKNPAVNYKKYAETFEQVVKSTEIK